jgi:hypothetical protein
VVSRLGWDRGVEERDCWLKLGHERDGMMIVEVDFLGGWVWIQRNEYGLFGI